MGLLFILIVSLSICSTQSSLVQVFPDMLKDNKTFSVLSKDNNTLPEVSLNSTEAPSHVTICQPQTFDHSGPKKCETITKTITTVETIHSKNSTSDETNTPASKISEPTVSHLNTAKEQRNASSVTTKIVETTNITTIPPTTPTIPSKNVTVPESPKPSEVGDMTNHDKYEGGSDVDEKGAGTHKEFKSKEEEVLEHQKITNESYKDVIAEVTSLTLPNGTSVPSLKKNADVMEASTAAGIAAGVCIILALLAYVGLVIRRKVLLSRYGNREILINEEDLADTNDENLRVFEAARIQIED